MQIAGVIDGNFNHLELCDAASNCAMAHDRIVILNEAKDPAQDG
jgi:hypothetical protein